MKNDLVTPKHLSYRSDIDGLRAIAVLSVVGFHAFPDRLKGGFIGVDIFFVISGFLISTILFTHLERGTFDLFDFYSRRIKRIFPSLLIILVFCLILGWFVLLAGEYKTLGKHTAAGAGFVSNLILWNEIGYFDIDAETKPLLHLWSLGIEEQFYLVWPLLLFIFWKIRQNLVILITLTLFISFVQSIWYINTNNIAAFYAPQSRFWELISGSIVGWIYLNNNDINQNKQLIIRNLVSLIGLILIIAGLVLVNKRVDFPGWWTLIPVVGTVLLICAGPNSWINKKFLSNRYLVWIGLISYPLYLWHWPILSYLHIIENGPQGKINRIFAILISIMLAWLTYKIIEQPIRFRIKTKFIVILLCTLMFGVGGFGYYIYKLNGLAYRDVVVQSFDQKQIVKIESNSRGICEGIESYKELAQFCRTFMGPIAGKKIVLWGDSSIDAWSPVFQDVAKQRNDSLIVISHLSCPPIINARKTRFDLEESRQYCADGTLQKKIINYIRNLNPDLIVVIASWNSYSGFSNREFIKGNTPGDADAKTTRQMMSVDLPETLELLSKISKTVVFKSWPILPVSPRDRVVSFLSKNKNEIYLDRKEFIKDSEFVNMIFDKLDNHRIKFFDPANRICNIDFCLSYLDGIKMYADKYHITPQGAMQFKFDIESLLKE